MNSVMSIRCAGLVSIAFSMTRLCYADVTATDTALEEITVTAQKRSENLQKVPIQIDVLNDRNIEALHIRDTSEIVTTIPNMVVERTDTYRNSTIVLRGISQAASADPPVAVIVDGVPQDDSKQFLMRLYDIAQIEVLKGPQGSLYGRNAEAGAIIITTRAPTNELHGFANISYGNGQTEDGNAGLSGAIVPDKVLFRVAGTYYSSDGLIKNTFRGDDSDRVPYDWSLRARLDILASENVTIDLRGEFGEFEAGGVFFTPVFSGNANDFQHPQSNFPNRDAGQSGSLTAKLDAKLGFATFSSISGYSKIIEHQITDVDFTNPVFHPEVFQVGDNQPSSNRILSQEFRLVGSSSSPVRWLLSADYLNADQFLSTNIFVDTGHPSTDPTNPALLLVSNPGENKRSDYGASGQIDYDVLPSLTLTAGLRFDEDRRRQTNTHTGLERHANFNAWQPKLTASYKFDDSKLVYVTYGEGFRSGAFNPPNFHIPLYQAEKLKNYEVGFKTEWLERRLSFNGAVFTGTVDNYQFSYIDLASASGVTGNIDRVRISGGELEVRFNVIGGLNLFASAGLTNPKITKFSLFPQDIGNTPPRNSKYSLNGGFEYTRAISDRLSVFVRSDVEWYGKRYWFIDNADIQDPKTYVNASFGLKSGSWTATVWGKNLFASKSYETFFPMEATGAQFDLAYPNVPASYGIELSYKF